MSEADWNALEAEAGAVLEHADRWPAWWAAAAPTVERWVSSPSFVGRIATDEDHRREVVVLTWERLQERDHAKLRAFFERPGDAADAEPPSGQRFRAWLRRVVKNIGIDYMRSLPEYVRRRTAVVEPADGAVRSHDYWLSIVTITSGAAVFRDPSELQAEALRMLVFLDDEVAPRRRHAVELARGGRPLAEVAAALGVRDQREAARIVARAEERLKFRPALELWSHGHSDQEIADALQLADAAAADRMVKAAKELLRRSFRP